jgi:hypothetical protein
MDENKLPQSANPRNVGEDTPSSLNKKAWMPPKLAFIEPKLSKHGELTEITGQFFGAFSPGTPV